MEQPRLRVSARERTPAVPQVPSLPRPRLAAGSRTAIGAVLVGAVVLVFVLGPSLHGRTAASHAGELTAAGARDVAVTPTQSGRSAVSAIAGTFGFGGASGTALPITILENGHPLHVQTRASNVGDALRNVGVLLGPKDRVEPAVSTRLSAGLTVLVEHARHLTIAVDGRLVSVDTWATTVGQALLDAGIGLGESDRVSPPPSATAYDTETLSVTRVNSGTVFVDQVIPHETITREDPNLSPGQTRVVEGRDGLLRKEVLRVLENGAVTRETVVRSYVALAPVPRVIYRGVLPYVPSAVPAGPAIGSVDGYDYARKLHVFATWYDPASAGRPRSNPNYGRTSTGVMVQRGVIAANPKIFPYGTKIYVPGYGIGVVADTGYLADDQLDLGFPDGVQNPWRTQWLDVYILAN